MEKHIILLNGSSSAGKSTLAKALQALIADKRKERYEIVSIDDFLKMTTEDVIYEDDVYEISGPLCEMVMEVFNANQGVIIDHVITSERIFAQLKEAVSPHRLWTVRVTCPLEIIRKREQERKDRCPGSAEASYTYLFPKEGYDLTVDTHFMTTSECVNKIFDGILEEEKMIYYKDADLEIRNMEEADDRIFYEEYTAQGWHPEIGDCLMRLKDQAEGKCVALTAVYQGHPAGSVYVYLTAHEGPFKGKGVPEIFDFNVLQKYQRKGIGNKLMEVAEQIAGQYADTVCLGVGLCDAYGSAQRMYVKRGYIPDGSGVWYQDKQCVQYETVCTIDDDLVLFLSKKLRD